MDKRERVARAICAEKCAFMGEPPCYTVEGDWPNPNCSEPGCDAEAYAAIAALEPVKVKPLVWGSAVNSGRSGMNLQADCSFGRYYIALRAEYGWMWWRPSSGPAHMGIEPSEKAAKAAAQADYERRILDALEPGEPVTVQEAARVLLGATPNITAKPLAEMSDAMKIDEHPAILLRGFCAALRAIAEGKE